jgi:hypothetical protein
LKVAIAVWQQNLLSFTGPSHVAQALDPGEVIKATAAAASPRYGKRKVMTAAPPSIATAAEGDSVRIVTIGV